MHELTTDETVEYVRTGKCDLGLVSIADPDPQLVARVVYAEALQLACSARHPLAQRGSIGWAELSNQTHIALRSVYSTRKTIDRILREQGLQLRSSVQAGTLATALKLVQADLGVTLIPGYARAFAETLGLKVLAIHDDQSHLHELSLLTRRGLKPSIAAGAFMLALDRYLQQPPA